MDTTWHLVFQIIIFLVLAFLGTTLTQAIKLWLKVEDRGALAITAGVSAVFAVAELFLSQAIGLADFTLTQFPQTFFTIFTLASIYFGWFKGSDSIFGKGGILRTK
jgi:uncharacterized membrane protein